MLFYITLMCEHSFIKVWHRTLTHMIIIWDGFILYINEEVNSLLQMSQVRNAAGSWQSLCVCHTCHTHEALNRENNLLSCYLESLTLLAK